MQKYWLSQNLREFRGLCKYVILPLNTVYFPIQILHYSVVKAERSHHLPESEMPLREHSNLLRWANSGNWGKGSVLQVKPSCHKVCRGCVCFCDHLDNCGLASFTIPPFFLAFWSWLLQSLLLSLSQNYFCPLFSHNLTLLSQSSVTRP